MDNELQKLLGNKIRKLRKNSGLNQDELAEKLGIATNTLSNIERGKAFMTSATLEKIANIFCVSYSDLFKFNNEVSAKDLYNNIIKRLNNIKEDKDKLLAIDYIVNLII